MSKVGRGENDMQTDEIHVGDRVEVTSGRRRTTGTVEKITGYQTAVLRLDGLGGTLSATLRELRRLYHYDDRINEDD